MARAVREVDPLLTVEEAMAVLRVSEWTIYQLIKSRQLRSLKIGTRRLIRPGAIEDYLAQREESEA